MGERISRRISGKCICATIAALLIIVNAQTIEAQEADASETKALKSKIDDQQRQIEELELMLRTQQSRRDGSRDSISQEERIRKLAETVFKAKEETKKKEDETKKRDEAAQGYEVGSDLSMAARWNADMGLLLETKHKDFSLHIGGRFQQDYVWWQQPGASLASPSNTPKGGFAGTAPLSGGVGQMEDGTFFRRVRLNLDGACWDVIEYNLEYAFENFGNNTGVGQLDEFFIGVKDMPWIGTVRVGHLRVAQGLEGDLVSSSRDMTFLERASFSDAFYENFAPGLWVGNHILCDRATYAFMAYRQEAGTISAGQNVEFDGGTSDGAAILNGNFGYSGRVTALPCYCYDGRELVHLGVSCSYRSALPDTVSEPAPAGTPAGSFVDFSARPEMRDTIGNYKNIGPGNSSRFVDTGLVRCSDALVPGFEFLTILGPLTVQAEWAWAYALGVTAVPSASGLRMLPEQTLGFSGGYIQLAYFLTGENRIYDRRLGRLPPHGVHPYTPFWLVRDGGGHICTGSGAWEIAARYSYLNLDDGPVQGGILGSTTLGLNWYLNNNLKIQIEWLHADRWGLTLSAPGTFQGAIDSFGIRTQISF